MTPVQGEQGVYDTERADEPLQNGTPLNKSTLLSGEVENQLGLDENSTPSDAFLKLILLLSELKNFVHDILDSDDETLDELSEIVAYIKNNRDFIQEITDGKVSVSDIVNNLTTNDAKKPLSAAQGYLLQQNKANKSDIATTATLPMSNSTVAYAKISNFGSWGTGIWYEKGFSMLITSRGGELIWVAVSSDDSNTNAKAIRLLNTYSKISAVYYSVSESAVYVQVNAWCNNVNAHILSNVNGDYVPTVVQANALPSDAVKITIAEFGITGSDTNIGDSSRAIAMTGSGARPTYNGNNIAIESDVNSRAPAYSYGTSDLTAGSSPLETGKLHFVYE
ncbi:MAG: hypothetical protein U0M02_06950 [Acutalibacteraceae bacterium]|nr:hypothetical protein [Acutalibacteraceae bacterium]